MSLWPKFAEEVRAAHVAGQNDPYGSVMLRFAAPEIVDAHHTGTVRIMAHIEKKIDPLAAQVDRLEVVVIKMANSQIAMQNGLSRPFVQEQTIRTTLSFASADDGTGPSSSITSTTSTPAENASVPAQILGSKRMPYLPYCDPALVSKVPPNETPTLPLVNNLPRKYKMASDLMNVNDVWREWAYGISPGPAMRDLEAAYSFNWRNWLPADKTMHNRRQVIWLEIEQLMKEGVLEDLAVAYVEKMRGGKSLNQLCRRLKGGERAATVQAVHEDGEQRQQIRSSRAMALAVARASKRKAIDGGDMAPLAPKKEPRRKRRRKEGPGGAMVWE